ncbi:UNVERIFIED_CONTAM: DIS3-like exonuclease 2 [Sesamum radiatum]|uniref:DIS3-like exonuclease 2 n=1 Tax=Sesamum radiatum TaxID=300843 RepID=A0AAW2QE43_SESRA
MGVLIVESSRGSTHTEEIFVDNDFKDNKKKKRRSRKSKQTSSACSSVSEVCMDASSLLGDNTSSHHVVPNGHHQSPKVYNTSCHVTSDGHHQLPKEYDAGSISMPSMHAKEQTADGNMQNQHSVPHEIKEVIFSKSVPESAVSEEPVGPVLIARPVDCYPRRKCYPPHWSAEAVNKALEKGELLIALFHVNAHNRLEAYCKIDGVQTDVLISGLLSQNRAIEGDTVAIVIDSPSLWPRMKGSNETVNNSAPHSNSHEASAHVQDCSRGKSKLDLDCEYVFSSDNMVFPENGAHYNDESSCGAMPDNSCVNGVLDNGFQPSISDYASQFSGDAYDSISSLEKLCALISLYPSKRPTGRVVAVVGRSPRRDNIVGFLSVKQWIYSRESKKKNSRKNKHQSDHGYILLTPTDPKFTKMMVPVRKLPASIKKRLEAGDLTIESDLVAARIVDWAEECYIPDACVIQIFGRGSDVEAQLAAILFENAIDASEFSPEVLSCLPPIPWEIPQEELQSRRDLRNLCIFTIDPASASDLDDALSVEKLSDGVFRVGVHIADVSFFVLPDTALDIDAQIRSTSVYLLQRKLPMLPSMLSDNLASLNPGEDRLAFSIFWDINLAGEVLDRWIGRTIIRSCSKLSYEHAQEIIDEADLLDCSQSIEHWPKLYGHSEWSDVVKSVKSLHEISKKLRENRFKGGAVSLESPKVVFLFDEEGMPYDSVLSGRKDSNFLVEEFMLLANRTAAEVITRAYPSCALLRRHPEPNARKLRDFETFCNKHGLKMDISSSTHLHHSLEHVRGELKNDSVLFDILMSYAARPMQLASYFCSGDMKDISDCSHYALAVPLYTHFTSPLRRYPDIVVHRTLAAAMEAEDIYLKGKRKLGKITEKETLSRCFTGMCFDKVEIESVEAQEALSTAASKHRVPGTETLADVAAHCNEKKLATRHVKDATDKLYMWVLLKKKEILYSEARVLGLGPKFMSIYIPKLAIERRVYYDEVEGLTVEWLDTTSTLVLSQSTHKRRRSSPGKCRTLEEVALIVNPADLELEMSFSGHIGGENGESQRCLGISEITNNEPAFFPITVHLLSTIPVALHAVGGDDGPLDIVARLYVGSYLP